MKRMHVRIGGVSVVMPTDEELAASVAAKLSGEGIPMVEIPLVTKAVTVLAACRHCGINPKVTRTWRERSKWQKRHNKSTGQVISQIAVPIGSLKRVVKELRRMLKGNQT